MSNPEKKVLPPSDKKFDILDEDWKDRFATASVDDINDEIARIAKNQAELDKAKEEDEDLKSLKEDVKNASAVYRDGAKANKTKVKWLIQVLGDRGAE